jgi:hypothetical protein
MKNVPTRIRPLDHCSRWRVIARSHMYCGQFALIREIRVKNSAPCASVAKFSVCLARWPTVQPGRLPLARGCYPPKSEILIHRDFPLQSHSRIFRNIFYFYAPITVAVRQGQNQKISFTPNSPIWLLTRNKPR